MSKRILLVEDEPGLVLTLTDRLTREGYAVESASDGESGLERASREPFDLLLLDLMLPRMSGFDVCRELRRRAIETPVIMLTARGAVVDKVVGLKLGADDYVTKPFGFLELMARVEAILRRGSAGKPGLESYRFGDVEVDFKKGEARKKGKLLDLSPRELRLLEFFIRHRGEVVAREVLLDTVWGYDSAPLTRTVDMHVAKLRKKIEDPRSEPKFLITIHRMGYKFTG